MGVPWGRFDQFVIASDTCGVQDPLVPLDARGGRVSHDRDALVLITSHQKKNIVVKMREAMGNHAGNTF